MDLILDEITDDTRVLLGGAAKCGTGWFKNITAMEGVAREVVGPRLADCAENFRNKIKSIFDWIADDDE
jgi:hypothetical protein